MSLTIPLIDQLYVFQQEGYNVGRFLGTVARNPFMLGVQKVKSLDWTDKAKWITVSAVCLFLLELSAVLIILSRGDFLGTPAGLLILVFSLMWFLFFPWIYLILGLYTKIPVEIFNRYRLKELTRAKVQTLKAKGLKVIGITGSYGKTSTKAFMSQILSESYKVYATPKSYNTLFGIAQPDFKFNLVSSVLGYLDDTLEYFLVEMGAYTTGEIAELCYAYPHDMAILTGITSMHLERFKSLKNIIRAKCEIISHLPNDSTVFINGDNKWTKAVAKILSEGKGDVHGLTGEALDIVSKNLSPVTYGYDSECDFRCEVTHMDQYGTSFEVYNQGHKYEFETKIVGAGNILNITGAISVALSSKIAYEKVKKSVSELQSVDARMQILDNGTGTITINNGYSSNFESFKQTLETLKLFSASYKVLVTPGIFELGNATERIHQKLGLMVPMEIDCLILVKNQKSPEQINGLLAGLEEKSKYRQNQIFPSDRVVLVDRIEECYQVVNQRNLIPSIVALENDVPDVYNI